MPGSWLSVRRSSEAGHAPLTSRAGAHQLTSGEEHGGPHHHTEKVGQEEQRVQAGGI
jgi:hypothetical protein